MNQDTFFKNFLEMWLKRDENALVLPAKNCHLLKTVGRDNYMTQKILETLVAARLLWTQHFRDWNTIWTTYWLQNFFFFNGKKYSFYAFFLFPNHITLSQNSVQVTNLVSLEQFESITILIKDDPQDAVMTTSWFPCI